MAKYKAKKAIDRFDCYKGLKIDDWRDLNAGKVVDLGVQFTNGVADGEINKRTGEIIYLDNRPAISRNVRQKEDIKIVLEF